MFERFLGAFEVSTGQPVSAPDGPSVAEWMDAAGGRSFARGMYFVHSREEAERANGLVRVAFPEFEGRISCFGRDWLGRQFSTDSQRGTGLDHEVLLFEPGTGEALLIPTAFSSFHDTTLVDFTEAALASGFYDQWLQQGGDAPNREECVGYKQLLFLGGRDEVDNLELSDLEVYWAIAGQMRVQLMGMPEGTRVRGLRVEP
jgi:hypothetical protein